jgi:hypothetical protein
MAEEVLLVLLRGSIVQCSRKVQSQVSKARLPFSNSMSNHLMVPFETRLLANMVIYTTSDRLVLLDFGLEGVLRGVLPISLTLKIPPFSLHVDDVFPSSPSYYPSQSSHSH